MKASFSGCRGLARPAVFFLTSLALAVGVIAGRAEEAPVVTPATGEVLKLVRAGMDASLVKTYISNASGPYSLDSNAIIYLTDSGVPSEVIALMLARDGAANAGSVAPSPSAPPPVPVPAPEVSPAVVAETPVTDVPADAEATTVVTLNSFNRTLSPYGNWVEVEGYGRVWRPTVAIYDPAWQPYCERGQWINTEAGWYWSSDYAWGATFHYGRWFHHARWGWCWWPDTVWAPSWVMWRSDEGNCGWAPLPPHTTFQVGVGLFYNGAVVAADYDFGMDASLFVFVPSVHFCDRSLREFRLGRAERLQIFRRTHVEAGFVGGDRDHRFIVNRGIPVEHIQAVTHHAIVPVAVSRVALEGRHNLAPGRELPGWSHAEPPHRVEIPRPEHSADGHSVTPSWEHPASSGGATIPRESGSQHPVVEHPVTQHPITQHPVEQHPVVQHPVVQHPVVQHPVVQHPVVQHPVVVSPAPAQPSPGVPQRPVNPQRPVVPPVTPAVPVHPVQPPSREPVVPAPAPHPAPPAQSNPAPSHGAGGSVPAASGPAHGTGGQGNGSGNGGKSKNNPNQN